MQIKIKRSYHHQQSEKLELERKATASQTYQHTVGATIS